MLRIYWSYKLRTHVEMLKKHLLMQSVYFDKAHFKVSILLYQYSLLQAVLKNEKVSLFHNHHFLGKTKTKQNKKHKQTKNNTLKSSFSLM